MTQESPVSCFLTFSDVCTRLSCNPSDGSIFLSENRLGWEKWEILVQDVTLGNFLIKHKASLRALSADSSGNISTEEVKANTGTDRSVLWTIKENKVTSVAFPDLHLAAVPNIDRGGFTPKATSTHENQAIMEYITGEICFLSSPDYDRRISCGPMGKMSMSANWQGWEAFRIIEVGDGNRQVRITSWTHDTKVLSHDDQGRVFMSDNEFGMQSKWVIERPDLSSKGVAVKSAHFGSYLTYNGEMFVMEKSMGNCTLWDISCAHRQMYQVTSICHDKRIGCNNGHGTVFCTKNRQGWEAWIINLEGDGLVSFKSYIEGGKYLNCTNGGELKASHELNGEALWKLEYSPHGGIFIISREHGRYLSCDGKGLCTTTDEAGGWETWVLVPIMPPTINMHQITIYSSIGAATLALSVAMPFAIMSIIGGMRFTGGGITAGSIAAGMMSAEAIASGGGVAAGGTVAVLQSIGTSGLGAAGFAGAIGAGGVIGASGGGIVIAVSGKNGEQKNKGISINAMLAHCNWRQWE
ncbi:hypothetical protein ACHAXS_004875 [Conticribra weissflogii]